uniref:Uncharacterized protein n=1 Tax=Lactuca sativa TaxID=4236 RepID=A0A9R1WMH4_LACSA|nr:hypothetical protein LSAT_V11C100025270 [Lactuca sativa]
MEDVNKNFRKLTFTPTQADRFVLAFRNLLGRHGKSQPEWFGQPNIQSLPSTYLSKRQLNTERDKRVTLSEFKGIALSKTRPGKQTPQSKHN